MEKATKPFSGFGWIETGSVDLETLGGAFTTKPFSGFGWIETNISKSLTFGINYLLNHSLASAGLKPYLNILTLLYFSLSTKPFSGFGWIETKYRYIPKLKFGGATKPFSGFGWIETCSYGQQI